METTQPVSPAVNTTPLRSLINGRTHEQSEGLLANAHLEIGRLRELYGKSSETVLVLQEEKTQLAALGIQANDALADLQAQGGPLFSVVDKAMDDHLDDLREAVDLINVIVNPDAEGDPDDENPQPEAAASADANAVPGAVTNASAQSTDNKPADPAPAASTT